MTIVQRAFAAFEAADTAARSIMDSLEAEDRELTTEEQDQISTLVTAAEEKRAAYDSAVAASEARSRFDGVVRPAVIASNGEERSALASLVSGENRAAVDLPTTFLVGPSVNKQVLSVGDTDFIRPLDKMVVPAHASTIPVGKFGAVTLTDSLGQGASLTDGAADMTSANLTITKSASFAKVASEVINNIPESEARIRNKFTRAANTILRTKVAATLVAAAGVETATASVVTILDLMGLPDAIDSDVRGECYYILSPEMVSLLSDAKGTTNDHFHYNPALGVFTLRGYRVLEGPMQAGSDDDVVAAFVHPEAITVAASGFTVERDDSVDFTTDQITFRGIYYTGAIVNDAAFVNTLTVQAA